MICKVLKVAGCRSVRRNRKLLALLLRKCIRSDVEKKILNFFFLIGLLYPRRIDRIILASSVLVVVKVVGGGQGGVFSSLWSSSSWW